MECSALCHPSEAHTEQEACISDESEAEKMHRKKTVSKHGKSTAVVSSQQLWLSTHIQHFIMHVGGAHRPPLSDGAAGGRGGNFLLINCPCASRWPPTHAQVRRLLVRLSGPHPKQRRKKKGVLLRRRDTSGRDERNRGGA